MRLFKDKKELKLKSFVKPALQGDSSSKKHQEWTGGKSQHLKNLPRGKSDLPKITTQGIS
jgi:hypothetical protein